MNAKERFGLGRFFSRTEAVSLARLAWFAVIVMFPIQENRSNALKRHHFLCCNVQLPEHATDGGWINVVIAIS